MAVLSSSVCADQEEQRIAKLLPKPQFNCDETSGQKLHTATERTVAQLGVMKRD